MDAYRRIEIPEGILVPETESWKHDIWKTVDYVSRNGDSFEEKLEKENVAFIKQGHEYYDYYKYLLEIKKTSGAVQTSLSSSTQSHVPLEPYPFVFSTYRSDIDVNDLELIKVTAHFCVVNNGVNYIEKLRERYQENPRFAFLDLNHSLNSVLTDFINQYEQIQAKEFGPAALIDGSLRPTVLRRAFHRAEYEELQEELKDKTEESARKVRIRFAAYEWDKFEVVDKIVLNEEEISKLPNSLDFDELKRSVLQRNIPLFNTGGSVSTEKISKRKKRMKIRAAGETRTKRDIAQTENGDKRIKCPITGKLIPESQFDTHLKVLLSDPMYKEERKKYEDKHKLTNLSSTEVYENIKKLMASETDRSQKRQKV